MQGFVFVHGINQTEKNLSEMDDHILSLLKRNGMIERFAEGKHVWVAKWRSLGSFIGDIHDLSVHHVRRTQAVVDIKSTIQRAWDVLIGSSSKEDPPRLLVCAHSMGQPLAVVALHEMQVRPMVVAPEIGGLLAGPPTYPVRTSLLSVGGPMANDDPLINMYFEYGADMRAWVKTSSPQKPEALVEWRDVWNPLDPVCHATIMGSSKYPGSGRTMFKVPEQPQLMLDAVKAIEKYHSAYFDYPEIYQIAAEMLDRLSA